MFRFFVKPEVFPSNFSPSREKIILDYCANKKVLHIGACDWPFTKQKMQKNNLLYSRIDSVCSEQLGIDLDKESIGYLNSLNRFKNSRIAHSDMNEMDKIDFDADVIVMGEVIEHLMNLEIALSNIAKLKSDRCVLIVTTPNALDFRNILNGLRSVEMCHFDHKVLFSFKTLTQLLTANKFRVTKSLFSLPFFPNYSEYKCGKKLISFLLTLPFYLFPLFASTLVVIAQLPPKEASQPAP